MLTLNRDKTEIVVPVFDSVFDSARDLLLKDKILPAELFIKNVCLLKFFDLSQYEEQSRNQKLLIQDF